MDKFNNFSLHKLKFLVTGDDLRCGVTNNYEHALERCFAEKKKKYKKK